MHTTFILIHVSAMIASLALMGGAVSFGLFGKRIAARLATAGFFATVVGFASGGILLFNTVLSLECALLTAYLLGVTLLYHLGFAFGDADKARFIRAS